MKNLIHYLGISALLVFIFSSCEGIPFFNKEDSFFEKETNFYECHNEKKWDSLSIENSLIGSWEYTYRKCTHTSSGFVSEGLAYDSLKIYADQTLHLIDNDTISKSAQWAFFVERNTGGPPVFFLRTDPQILEGEIFFCEDRVVLRDFIAIRQVCSYYFKRFD